MHRDIGAAIVEFEARHAASALPLVIAAAPELRLTAADLFRQARDDGENAPRLSLVAVRRSAGSSDPEVLGIGMAVVRSGLSGQAPIGHLKALAVSRSYRRRGIGGEILGRLEDFLREQGVGSIELDGAAPNYLQPGVPRRAVDALAFFAAHGYTSFERRRSLIAAIDPAVPFRWSENHRGFVEIERASLAAVGEIRARVAAELAPAWAVELERGAIEPDADSFVARIDGSPAGFATARLWARNAFGPTGTFAEFRGRGVGAALFRRSLQSIAHHGERSAVISWIGPEEFYRRFLPKAEVEDFIAMRKVLDAP